MMALTPAQNSTTDLDLLTAFARSGDEAAFAAIVGRYAGFVRSIAQRTTENVSAAEEVAQSVFALLARKARSVARTAHLTGWLHRTTVYIALRHARTEMRHRRKLTALAHAMPLPVSEPPAPVWEAALPVLDACIQRLREGERHVLILRYFEGLSYAGIGAATGKSEEAAKKQTARALERLRRLMGRRGVALTTTSLTSGLTSLTSPPATAAASSLTAAALKAAPSLTWKNLVLHSLHLMDTTKAAVAAAVILLLGSVPLIKQENSIAAMRQEVAALEQRAAGPPALAGQFAALNPRPPVPPAAPQEAGLSDIEQIARDFESLRTVKRDAASETLTPEQRAARERIAALTTAKFDRLLGEVSSLAGGTERQEKVRVALFNELTVRPADKAARLVLLRHAADIARSTENDALFKLQQRTQTWLIDLLKEDPDAALAEYLALKNSSGIEGRGTMWDGQAVYGQFVGKLYAVRPGPGRELYADLALGGRINALFGMVENRDPAERGFILGEIAKLEPRQQTHQYQMLLAVELAYNGLAGAATLFHSLSLSPDQAVAVAAGFVGETNSARAQAGLTVQQRLDWLKQQLAPEQFAAAGALFLSKSIEIGPGRRDSDTARMKAFRDCDWGSQRDLAIATFFKRDQPPDKAGPALALAVEITDPVLRMETLQRLSRRFKDEPADYQKAVEACATLSAGEKSKVFQQQ